MSGGDKATGTPEAEKRKAAEGRLPVKWAVCQPWFRRTLVSSLSGEDALLKAPDTKTDRYGTKVTRHWITSFFVVGQATIMPVNQGRCTSEPLQNS